MNRNRIFLPNHIAIIPDGNRRWAKKHGVSTFEGHKKGAETALKLAKKIRELDISTTTIWGFSTENWERARQEAKYLMELFRYLLDRHLNEAVRDNVRIIHLGRKDRLPKRLLQKIAKAEDKTKNFTKFYLNIALDYGGQNEIIRAIKKLSDVKNLTEEIFSKFLDTGNQPYPFPDLIIRTSGEMRTSGLMIWQAAYAELVFIKKFFPDLSEKDIEKAVLEYSRRQRRFGR